MKKEYDFFSGFEGSDEYRIEVRSNKGKVKTIVKIWIGYINEIFSNIISNNVGDLEDVFSIYNTEIGGWYEVNNWELTDVLFFSNQLKKIDKKNISKESEEVIEVLLNIANLTIVNDYKIYISLI